MPYKIVKRGKEYILKSPTREYKHKSLAKARAQKRLLEEKEAKVVQKVSQKTNVVVTVNQPAPRRRGAPASRGVARPNKAPEPRVMMYPAQQPTPEQIAYAISRVHHYPKTDILEKNEDRYRTPLRPEPVFREPLIREPASRDADLLSKELFKRQIAVDRQQEQLMKIREPQKRFRLDEDGGIYPVAREMAIAEPVGGGLAMGRDRAELERMTVLELRQILRDRGQTIGKKNKAELIDAILG
jgi:hypothetical protein